MGATVMRRVMVLVLALGLLAACESGSDGGGERSADGLADRAAEVTDQLAANEWASIRKDFDETMTEGLSEEGLQQAWEQVVATRGKYESRGEPSEAPRTGGVTVYDTPMKFEQGDMKSRVAFDSDGRIAGLFILVPEAP